jgi:hypothetical protein
VPWIVTSFDWSNIANEWWANAELAGSIAAMAMRVYFSTLLICSSTDLKISAFLSQEAPGILPGTRGMRTAIIHAKRP